MELFQIEREGIKTKDKHLHIYVYMYQHQRCITRYAIHIGDKTLMRKLNKKQKTLIQVQAENNYNKGYISVFIEADDLPVYDALCDLNIYENMDSDIERYYSDCMMEFRDL